MKGKDLNKRLRELRSRNTLKARNNISNYPDFIAKYPFTGKEAFYIKTAMDFCNDCEGTNIRHCLFEDKPGSGYYCIDCKTLVEVTTKEIK